MTDSLPSLWKLGGLGPVKLTKLVIDRISEHELWTRSASLAYYFLLAVFPMFLFLVSLVGVLAGPGSQLRHTIVTALGHVAPGSASEVVHRVVNQTFKSSGGLKLAAGIVGALWAASGGLSAVVTSLNVVYRTKETRPWWKQKLIVVGLTLALSLLIIVAIVLVLYGGRIGRLVASHVGLGTAFEMTWRMVQWPVILFAMFFSFSLIYHFSPNLKQHRWNWVSPGAVAGVILWLVASIGFRIYLHYFNRYSATYGSLGAVIILMLWLYLTGFAVLIGGEVNCIIENQDRTAAAPKDKIRLTMESPKAA